MSDENNCKLYINSLTLSLLKIKCFCDVHDIPVQP